MIAMIAQAAAAFLLRKASTAAPPGTWLTMALIVPTESASPISPWVHLCDARYEAMNGPKPVCTFATKKLSQSSARTLRRLGVGWVFWVAVLLIGHRARKLQEPRKRQVR